MGVQISGDTGNVLATKGTYTGNLTVGGVLTYEDVTNVDSVGLVTARSGIEIGARPGVAASISVDGNMIVSGVTTFTPGGSEIVRINSGGLLVYNDVSFFGASTHAYWDHSSNQFALSDNTKLSVGNSSDLSIYHDGTKSIINDSGTGWLEINTNNLRVQNAAANETLLYATENGSVQLMHDNSKKLETSSNGVTVTGTVTADGLVLSDSDEIQFGNSTDFRIYHDSSNSYIRDVGTGNLIISGSAVNILNGAASESMIRCTENGAVEQYHNNSVRLLTTTSGVTAGTPNTSQTAVVGAQAGFFGGAKSEYASATGLVQNQVCILDTATSAAAGTGGALTFAGYIDTDSTTFYATIEGIKETSTTNQYGGKLRFLTRTNNVANMVEGMVIDSTGRVGLGKNDPDYHLDISDNTSRVGIRVRQQTNNTANTYSNMLLRHAAAVPGQNAYGILFQNSGGTEVGKIDYGQSTTQYRTSSDYRLKENAVTISDGIVRLKTLKPYRFNFISEPDRTVDGFFAHEVTAVPEAISGTKDEVDSDNNPVYQGIDHSKLVPLLTAALQESVTEIESLKARLDAAGL